MVPELPCYDSSLGQTGLSTTRVKAYSNELMMEDVMSSSGVLVRLTLAGVTSRCVEWFPSSPDSRTKFRRYIPMKGYRTAL